MANETIVGVNGSYIQFPGFDTSGFCAVGKHPDNSGGYDGALRFTNIQIPKNATIDYAVLEYKYSSVGGTSGSWKFRVNGIDEDNTASFGYPFGRPQTTAQINVDEGPPTSGQGKKFDVKNILSEITSRSGWSSGNAVGFLFFDNSSSNNVYAYANQSTTYLAYRVSPEPNFKPTPTTISAPSLPTAADVGMKFSQPGVSVFDATDDECFLTTRKRTVMLFDEDIHTSTAANVTTIPHLLGYIPFVTVYAQEVSGDWRKIPRGNMAGSVPFYYVDDDYLYLSASATGQKFYYRIFIDRIV